MAKEIERKFLVISNGWRENAVGTHYRQGYLNSVKERTVQITLAVMSADCVFTPSVADDEKFSFYFFCHFKTP